MTNNRNLKGTQSLYEMGYKSKGDLEQAKLQALQAEAALKRETLRKKELITYTYVRTKKELEGALRTAERARIQVERNNEALLHQAKVAMESAKLSMDREEERLARYRQQLEKCTIRAPQTGMVAYFVEQSHWGQSSTIAPGLALRERQPILSIPNLQKMQVKTSVHESMVDRVRSGYTRHHSPGRFSQPAVRGDC